MASETRVDVALPVYNGEAYLERAIRSILDQDHRNLRLLISDNASTDRTEEICRRFADQDERIDYERQSTNIGAAPNFNVLYERSTAPYFKWAAADDVLAPTFLSKCAVALDAAPDAVLAFSRVEVIDPDGEVLFTDHPDARLGFGNAVNRFAQLIKFHLYPCYEIFGVFRREHLLDTQLIAPFSGGDRNLLAHVALRGPIVIVPEYLFQQRRHPQQSVRLVSDRKAYDEWFDPANRGKVRLPEWNRFWNYGRLLIKEPLPASQRVVAFAHLARQAAVRWRHLGSDIKRLLLTLPRSVKS